jgi:hypothetical protein
MSAAPTLPLNRIGHGERLRGRGARIDTGNNGSGYQVRFLFVAVSGRTQHQLSLDRTADLLHYVSQFVSQKLLSGSRARIVRCVPEENVLSRGERDGIQRSVERVGLRARVDSNPAEVRAKGIFHLTALT